MRGRAITLPSGTRGRVFNFRSNNGGGSGSGGSGGSGG